MSTVALISGTNPPAELIATLNDESAENRAMAVVALARFPRGLDPLIPSFFQMMEHDEPAVRTACERAMARLGPPGISPESVPALAAALRSPDRRVRAVACPILMQFGPRARAAIPALIRAAQEKPDGSINAAPVFPDLAHLAIEALGRIAPGTDSASEVIAALNKILRAEDRSNWNSAVYALAGFGPAAASAVPELVRGLRESISASSPDVDGHSAAITLGRIAPGTQMAGLAIADLTEALRASSPTIQSGAAVALAEFGEASISAIPDLIRMLKEPHELVPSGDYEAAAALGCIAPNTRSSVGAVAALIEALRSKSSVTRCAAAFALRKFGRDSAAAIPGLRMLTKDPDASVRRVAEGTLAALAGFAWYRDLP
jgi:HEAT repeat protein